jgi:Zn ribbon nucleic-acid-binding protein
MKRKRKKEPDAIAICPRCGEKHKFEKFEDLDELDIKTPCRKCGFLLHEHIFNKMDVTLSLFESGDQHAHKLLNEGKFEDFNKYSEKKTGLKDVSNS